MGRIFSDKGPRSDRGFIQSITDFELAATGLVNLRRGDAIRNNIEALVHEEHERLQFENWSRSCGANAFVNHFEADG
jgi:hypothetical protein